MRARGHAAQHLAAQNSRLAVLLAAVARARPLASVRHKFGPAERAGAAGAAAAAAGATVAAAGKTRTARRP